VQKNTLLCGVCNRSKIFFVICLIISWTETQAQARLRWKIYVDKNYGYSIPVPTNLSPLPWTGDPESAWQIRNRDFESKDGKVGLYISTHFTWSGPCKIFSIPNLQGASTVATG
jgi:hypothetical protein